MTIWAEAYDLPHLADPGKKIAYLPTLEYRFGRHTDAFREEGSITLPTGFSRLDQIHYVDPDDHTNDVGSVIHLFQRGVLGDDGKPKVVGSFVAERRPDGTQSQATSTTQISGRGLTSFFLDRMRLLPYDHPKNPTLSGDWIFGGPNLLGNPFFSASADTPAIFELVIGATSGTYTITDGTDTTDPIAFDAQASVIENRLETDIAAISEECVVTGTSTNPYIRTINIPINSVSALDLELVLSGGATHATWILTIEATGGTFTISNGGDETDPIAHNASAATIATRIETDLSAIVDVTVTDLGGGNEFKIVINDPVGGISNELQVDDAGATGGEVTLETETGLTRIQANQLSYAPWEPAHALTAPALPEGYDAFGLSSVQAHSGGRSLLVNPSTIQPISNRNPGIQQVIRVRPGQIHQASIWIYPTSATDRFRLGLFTTGEELIAWTQSNGVPLTINTWNQLTLSDVMIPDGVETAIFRAAWANSTETSYEPSQAWFDDAELNEGLVASNMGFVWELIQGDRLPWLIPTFTATEDSNGDPWDTVRSFTLSEGDTWGQIAESFQRLWKYVHRIRYDREDNEYYFDIFNPGYIAVDHSTTDSGSLTVGMNILDGETVTRAPDATGFRVVGERGLWVEDEHAALAAAWGEADFFLKAAEVGSADDLTDVLNAAQVQVADQMVTFEAEMGSENQVKPLENIDIFHNIQVNLGGKSAIPTGDRIVTSVVVSGRPGQMPSYQLYVNSDAFASTGAAALAEAVRRLLRKKTFTERPKLGGVEIGGGKGAPSIVIAASDSSEISKSKADFICDGTNDYQVIQEAINMLDGPGGRGRILLCEGEFYCTETINVLPGIHLQGVSRTHTFIYADDNANPLLDVGNGCTISDLYLDGAATDGNLIAADGGYTEIRDLLVEGGDGPDSIGIKKVSTGRLLIKNCIFDGTEGPAISAVAGAADYMTIDGCYFSQADGAVVVIPGTFNEEFIFVNNQIFSPISGVHLEGIIHGIVANNIWLSSGDEILTLDANCENVIVNGNLIYQTNEAGGIECAGTKCVITNNFIHGSGFAAHPGIQITGDNNLVSNNLIIEPDSHGIVITADHCKVSGNLISQPGVADDGLYDGIIVTGDNNMIQDNLIRPSLYGFFDTRYGINIVSGNDNVVHANYLGDPADYGTADFLDGGTGTITHPGANGQFNAGGGSLAAAPGIITFSQSDDLVTGDGTFQFPFPFDATLVSVIAAVGTAPTGDDIILDVELNGASIYPTAPKPTILDGAEVSALAPPDTTAVSAGDLLTVDIEQIGSGTPGSNLTVAIHYQ